MTVYAELCGRTLAHAVEAGRIAAETSVHRPWRKGRQLVSCTGEPIAALTWVSNSGDDAADAGDQAAVGVADQDREVLLVLDAGPSTGRPAARED